MSKLLKKPSVLKGGHPTLQNMNFYKLLSTFVGHFCPPGSGSGSTDPIEYGSGSTTLIKKISALSTVLYKLNYSSSLFFSFVTMVYLLLLKF
jgi:hypothetical protein